MKQKYRKYRTEIQNKPIKPKKYCCTHCIMFVSRIPSSINAQNIIARKKAHELSRPCRKSMLATFNWEGLSGSLPFSLNIDINTVSSRFIFCPLVFLVALPLYGGSPDWSVFGMALASLTHDVGTGILSNTLVQPEQIPAVMLRRAFLTILVVIGLALSGVQPFVVLSAEAGGFGFDTAQMAENHECEEHGVAHAIKNGGHCCVFGATGFVPAAAAIASIWPSKAGRIVGADDRAPTDRNIAIFKPPRAS